MGCGCSTVPQPKQKRPLHPAHSNNKSTTPPVSAIVPDPTFSPPQGPRSRPVLHIEVPPGAVSTQPSRVSVMNTGDVVLVGKGQKVGTPLRTPEPLQSDPSIQPLISLLSSSRSSPSLSNMTPPISRNSSSEFKPSPVLEPKRNSPADQALHASKSSKSWTLPVPVDCDNPLVSTNSLMSIRSEIESPRERTTCSPMTKDVVRGYNADGTKTLNEYQIVGTIGAGAFAKVKRAINERTKHEFAIKIMNKERLSKKIRGKGLTELQYAMREVEIMKTLLHPNLVRLHEVLNSEDSAKLYLVLEYVRNGPVCRTPTTIYVDRDTPYEATEMRDVQKVRSYVFDMLCALNFLHSRNIQHRDIKPENVLLTEDDQCKLADFGVSSLLDKEEDLVTTRDGTPLFFSPEMVQGNLYHGKPCDVWALGITVFILAFGRVPFPTDNFALLIKAIDTREICCPPCAPQLLCDFVYRLLAKEPSLRITVAQAMGHPFIRDRVPLSLSVRVWKEHKLMQMTDEEFVSVGDNCVFRDTTTDVSLKSAVDTGVLIRSLTRIPLLDSVTTSTPSRKSLSGSGESEARDSFEINSDGGVGVGGLSMDMSCIISPTVSPTSARLKSRKSILNPFHDGSSALGYGDTNNLQYRRDTTRAFPPPSRVLLEQYNM